MDPAMGGAGMPTGAGISNFLWQRQARLPQRHGGLGLRNAAVHAAGAYLASGAATRQKCQEIDPSYVWDLSAPGSHECRALAFVNGTLPQASQLTVESVVRMKQKDFSNTECDWYRALRYVRFTLRRIGIYELSCCLWSGWNTASALSR